MTGLVWSGLDWTTQAKQEEYKTIILHFYVFVINIWKISENLVMTLLAWKVKERIKASKEMCLIW